MECLTATENFYDIFFFSFYSRQFCVKAHLHFRQFFRENISNSDRLFTWHDHLGRRDQK